jgi:hypothetical protein
MALMSGVGWCGMVWYGVVWYGMGRSALLVCYMYLLQYGSCELSCDMLQ